MTQDGAGGLTRRPAALAALNLVRINPSRLTTQVSGTVRYRPLRSLLLLSLLLVGSLLVFLTTFIHYNMVAQLQSGQPRPLGLGGLGGGNLGGGIGGIGGGAGGGVGSGGSIAGRKSSRGPYQAKRWVSQFGQFKIEPLLVRNAPSVEVNMALAFNRRQASRVSSMIIQSALQMFLSSSSTSAPSEDDPTSTASVTSTLERTKVLCEGALVLQEQGTRAKGPKTSSPDNLENASTLLGDIKPNFPKLEECQTMFPVPDSQMMFPVSEGQMMFPVPDGERDSDVDNHGNSSNKKIISKYISTETKTRTGEKENKKGEEEKEEEEKQEETPSAVTNRAKTTTPGAKDPVTVPKSVLLVSKTNDSSEASQTLDNDHEPIYLREEKALRKGIGGTPGAPSPAGRQRKTDHKKRRRKPKDEINEQLDKLPLCPGIPPDLKGRLDMNITFLESQPLERVERRLDWVLPGGRWSPVFEPTNPCLPRHKIAVIIPYRDRLQHLVVLLSWLHPVLRKQQLEYTIYVVEQKGNATFNKGSVMNAGFVEAWRRGDASCFVFHDVDLLPEDDRNMYSCPAMPRHLSVGVDTLDYKLPYFLLVGGVLSIRGEHFLRVNGYSNMYWGWGGEDDDMGYRIKQSGLTITRPPTPVARYTMIRHQKRKPLTWKVRGKLVRTSGRRYRLDGLNTLRYSLEGFHRDPLFSHLLVDVGTPPENLIKLDTSP